ncbi:uncharacterized protein FA14DRAFT_152293 [Meira miltonrushii]|uniref:Uncharacterized protein n=1 Tax=Meira miltonrushii TaxID=1280837 RepID=A0A316VLC1_9BASI|nr:uncharacterized protein FA14DRAFT_152293 [Meira miltonrushii]PWN36871.1 hypothetical protein FA14DRAFT_152293 [Meira miltonrushii]
MKTLKREIRRKLETQANTVANLPIKVFQRWKNKAGRFREMQRQQTKRRGQRKQKMRESKTTKDLDNGNPSIRKVKQILSPADKKAAEIRAANTAALGQLSTTPKFMQKLKDRAVLPSTVNKTPSHKNAK